MSDFDVSTSPENDPILAKRNLDVRLEQFLLCSRALRRIFDRCPADTSWRKDGIGSCDYDGTKDSHNPTFTLLRESRNAEVAGRPAVGACKYHRADIGCGLGDLRGPNCLGHIDSRDAALPSSFWRLIVDPSSGSSALFHSHNQLAEFLARVIMGTHIDTPGFRFHASALELEGVIKGIGQTMFKNDPRGNWPAVMIFLRLAGEVYQEAVTISNEQGGGTITSQASAQDRATRGPARGGSVSSGNSSSLKIAREMGGRILTHATNVSNAFDALVLRFPKLEPLLPAAGKAVGVVSLGTGALQIASDTSTAYRRTQSVVSSAAAASRRFSILTVESLLSAVVYLGSSLAVGASGGPAVVVGLGALLVFTGIRYLGGESLSVERAYDAVVRAVARK